MTYIEDLERCTYGDLEWRGAREVAVGWLSAKHPFSTGDVPAECVGRLVGLVRDPVNRFRGSHTCEICPPEVLEPLDKPPASGQGRFRHEQLPDGSYRTVWYAGHAPGTRVTVEDEELSLGNGEVQVIGDDGNIYVAPTMILHYVVEHHYRPPEGFLEALRVGPVPKLPPEAFTY